MRSGDGAANTGARHVAGLCAAEMIRYGALCLVVLASACTPAPSVGSHSTPSVTTNTPSATPSVTMSVAPSPQPVRNAFPVAGAATYAHTHHGYPAADIFAACGTPYVSPVDGVVLESDRVDRWDPKVDAGATRGGLNISILGDDGMRYYGAHFSSIQPDVVAGAHVSAGQKLATVGRTGDAAACHVHFGLSPVCMRLGDWWIRRGVIWPWPYLDAWRKGEARSAVLEIEAWQNKNGCPAKPLVEP